MAVVQSYPEKSVLVKAAVLEGLIGKVQERLNTG